LIAALFIKHCHEAVPGNRGGFFSAKIGPLLAFYCGMGNDGMPSVQSIAMNHIAVLSLKNVEEPRLWGKAVEGHRSPRRFAFM
jgi:hypothetical protein